MSLKPLKKGESEKLLARRGKTRISSPEYHLIVSEGEETEPAYFHALEQKINEKYRGRVSLCILGGGDNTVNLFETARKRTEKDSGIRTYKHVWIVYDTDSFTAENVNKVVEMCANINRCNTETLYHAVWSNQCFELWYMLHFSYMHSDLHRKEYWPKLTEQLKKLDEGDYLKNKDDMFRILLPFIDDAIQNAEKLDAENGGKVPSKAAPGTKVHEMIKMFRPYL